MGNASSSELSSGLNALRNGHLPEDEAQADALLEKAIPAQPHSLDDMIKLLSPEDVRFMKERYPDNLVQLLLTAISILEGVIKTPDTAQYPRFMNAIRLLTRVMPILFEDEEWVHHVFVENAHWTGEAWEPIPGYESAELGTILHALCSSVMASFFLPDLTIGRVQYETFAQKLKKIEAEAYFAEQNRAGAGAGQEKEGAGQEGQPPTSQAGEGGEREGEGEAVPVVPTIANAVWPMLLWKGGVTFPLLSAPVNAAWTAARLDILRLMLALCSGPLFHSPQAGHPSRTPFLDFFTSIHCDFAPSLFYCLLNTVLAYDPVGYGVPYANSLVSDSECPLVTLSLQVLAVLLDYSPLVTETGEIVPAPQAEGAQPAGTTFAQFNVYRSLLSGLSEGSDFALLATSIGRMLSSIPSAAAAMLPGAYTPFEAVPELLVLLWKCLDENKEFANYVLGVRSVGGGVSIDPNVSGDASGAGVDVTTLVGPLLYLLWAGRSDVTKVGLLHVCTFTLLLLSGERAFGVAMNRPFPSILRAPFGGELPLFEGSFGDLLLLVLHKAVVDGSPKLAGLYSCFLTILANVSPYMKAWSLPASLKLLSLVELFSSPRFLFARPTNYAFVQQLLEALNNSAQYQYESNGVLVYSLVRRKDIFKRLAAVTPSGWIRELSARAAAKRAREEGAAGGAAAAPASEASPAGTGLPLPSPAGTGTDAEGEAQAAVVSRLSHTAGGESVLGTSTAPSGTDAAAPAAAAPAPSQPQTESWMASDEWWEGARQALPLDTLLRLTDHLGPILEGALARANGALDEEQLVDIVANTVMVGILPVPHPILMRRYAANAYTSLWYTTFLWSTVFLHVGKSVPLWDATTIKLFSITVL